MRPLLLVLATVFLPACAPMGEAQCRSTDWYALGERDGLIYGNRPGIDQYVHQCGRYGVKPSEKDYMAGWTDGYREFEKRVADPQH